MSGTFRYSTLALFAMAAIFLCTQAAYLADESLADAVSQSSGDAEACLCPPGAVFGEDGRCHGLGLPAQDPALLPEVSRLVAAGCSTFLPEVVDNSDGLPPVGDQGGEGACAAWSIGYYCKTYSEGKEHGWSVTQPDHQFCPAYIYNQGRIPEDGGMYLQDAYHILQELGCATLATMSYSPGDFRSWPLEKAYAEAIEYRIERYVWIGTSETGGMGAVKEHLARGGIGTLGIKIYANFQSISKYENTYCLADRSGPELGGHAITVVGYDDSRPTHDGVGAFRCVNSWGPWWGDGGFLWISYQAVADPHFSLCQGSFSYIEEPDGGPPPHAARFTMEYSRFRALELALSPSHSESAGDTVILFDFLSSIGSRDLAVAAPSHPIWVDLGQVQPLDDGDEVRLGVKNLDPDNGCSGTIRSFDLVRSCDLGSSSSGQTPRTISADGSQALVGATFRLGDDMPLACEVSQDPPSGRRIQFAADVSGADCDDPVSFAWDFGDGEKSGERSPTHTYGADGIYGWMLVATRGSASCSSSGTLTVGGPCTLACEATAIPTSGTGPLTASFMGSATTSNCTLQPSFTWDFGDGTISHKKDATHVYNSTGEFQWSLMVAADGASCSRNGTIMVSAGPPEGICAAVEGRYPYGPGYCVAAEGNRVYYGNGMTVMVADISNAAEPAGMGELVLSDTAMGLAVSGPMVYIANAMAGLIIVDWSDPAHPSLRGQLAFATSTKDVCVVGSRVYISDNEGFHVVDVSVPEHPVLLGSLGVPSIQSMAVSGPAIFLAAWYSGLYIVDISDPTRPIEVAHLQYPPYPAVDVAVSGDKIYLMSKGLRIIDVIDPAKPVEVGHFDLNDGAYVDVSGDRVFLGNISGEASFRIINAADPVHPIEEAVLPLDGFAYDITHTGPVACIAGQGGTQLVGAVDSGFPALEGILPTLNISVAIQLSGTLAYIGLFETGLLVLDVRERSAPKCISLTRLSGCFGNVWGVKLVEVSGDIAYLSDNGASGIRIFNVSAPESPVEIGWWGCPGQGTNEVVVSGEKAFVCCLAGLGILDISTSASPDQIGFLELSGVPFALGLSGDIAFVYERNGHLHSIDISNPVAPSEMGFLDTSEIGTARDIEIYGNYALLASQDALLVVDIQDPTSPRIISSVAEAFQFLSIKVRDHIAFAGGQRGVIAFDMSDAAKPFEVGRWETPGPVFAFDLDADHLYTTNFTGVMSIYKTASCPLGCALDCTADVPSESRVGSEVLFQAQITTDGCTKEPVCVWDFGDGTPPTTGLAPGHIYSKPGTYSWMLTVTADYLTCQTTGTLSCSLPCALDCTADVPSESRVGSEVLFQAQITTDGCTKEPVCVWDFGDGAPPTTGPTRGHIYSKPGTYSWRLTVTTDYLTCQKTGTLRIGSALPGDCDGDGSVSIGEVQKAVNMFLGTLSPACGVDANQDGAVSIGEIQKVINAFLGLGAEC